jgi:hypothetical protein
VTCLGNPLFAHLIVPNDSYHISEQKDAGINCLIDRVKNYPSPPQGKLEEIENKIYILK